MTTSCISDAIKELDGEAKAAGITVLNELAIDPGVDHLYSIKTFDEVYAKGREIGEFYSYCGGLPALGYAANNPLSLKFPWSPRGTLLSQRNSARFLSNGSIVDISSAELLVKARQYYVKDSYDFVAYPNRGSVPFRGLYNIPKAHTVIRGSLRYKDNPVFEQAWPHLG